MVVSVNGDYFLQQHWPVDPCKKVMFSLKNEWTLKYYFESFGFRELIYCKTSAFGNGPRWILGVVQRFGKYLSCHPQGECSQLQIFGVFHTRKPKFYIERQPRRAKLKNEDFVYCRACVILQEHMFPLAYTGFASVFQQPAAADYCTHQHASLPSLFVARDP
jgi:hypothetical protein